MNLVDNSVDAGRLKANLNSIKFGPWNISYDVSCILPSVCSTKVVCERNDNEFCQFCIYCKELKIPHFPDMVFPKNILTLTHENGSCINFNPLDALRCVASTAEAIEVSCAEAWQEARPDAAKKKRPFDWTFTTDYKGTLSDNILVEQTDEIINFEILKKKDQILFYHDLTLFEDELHDHGISKLSVKIRVMPTYWYVLLRYFLRVDDVLVRSHETRMFHMLNTDYVLREYTAKESKFQDLQMPTSQMKEADDVIPILPVKYKQTDKLTVNCAQSNSTTVKTVLSTCATVNSAPTTSATVNSAPTTSTTNSAPTTSTTVNSASTTGATVNSVPKN